MPLLGIEEKSSGTPEVAIYRYISFDMTMGLQEELRHICGGELCVVGEGD